MHCELPDFQNVLDGYRPDCRAQLLKREIEGLESGTLPLENALTQGGIVDDNSITVTVLSTVETESQFVA